MRGPLVLEGCSTALPLVDGWSLPRTDGGPPSLRCCCWGGVRRRMGSTAASGRTPATQLDRGGPSRRLAASRAEAGGATTAAGGSSPLMAALLSITDGRLPAACRGERRARARRCGPRPARLVRVCRSVSDRAKRAPPPMTHRRPDRPAPDRPRERKGGSPSGVQLSAHEECPLAPVKRRARRRSSSAFTPAGRHAITRSHSVGGGHSPTVTEDAHVARTRRVRAAAVTVVL